MLPLTSIKPHVSDTDTAHEDGKSNNKIIRFSAILGGGMLILGGLTTVNRYLSESYRWTHFSLEFPLGFSLGFAATCAGVNALEYAATTKVNKFSKLELIQGIGESLFDGFAAGSVSFLSGYATPALTKLVPTSIAPFIKSVTLVTSQVALNVLTKITKQIALSQTTNFTDINRIVWIGALQMGAGIAISEYLKDIPIRKFTYGITSNEAARGVLTGAMIALVQAIALKIIRSDQKNKTLLKNLTSSFIAGSLFFAVSNEVSEEITFSQKPRHVASWVPPYLNR
ncbi:hypothetical protein [Criblamydia sequanensis]|uniref:Membrane protein n=1 Tax=Candidatus Criblamydia sequanensis CRIB-18 TaxID=1437425 RepID=A0A090D1A4_9BACT|nr:hypothetical protein [Criblamydia sequanensis]CDR33418.1 putative membrane protein [Criblamydia sequanensis CRIB-18]